jgi:hypothetical protein
MIPDPDARLEDDDDTAVIVNIDQLPLSAPANVQSSFLDCDPDNKKVTTTV